MRLRRFFVDERTRRSDGIAAVVLGVVVAGLLRAGSTWTIVGLTVVLAAATSIYSWLTYRALEHARMVTDREEQAERQRQARSVFDAKVRDLEETRRLLLMAWLWVGHAGKQELAASVVNALVYHSAILDMKEGKELGGQIVSGTQIGPRLDELIEVVTIKLAQLDAVGAG